MTAGLVADGIGTARVIRTGDQGVIRSFAVDPADGMNRREVDDIEAHRRNRW